MKVDPQFPVHVHPGTRDIAEIERQRIHNEMRTGTLMADNQDFRPTLLSCLAPEL